MYVLSLSNSSLNSLGHNSFRMLKKIKITNLECSHMHWKSRSAGNLTFTDFTRCLILCVFCTLTPTSSQFLPSNRKSLKNSVDASTPELKQTKHFIYFSSFTDKISKFYLSKRCGNHKIVFVSSRPYFGLFFIPIHVPRA